MSLLLSCLKVVTTCVDVVMSVPVEVRVVRVEYVCALSILSGAVGVPSKYHKEFCISSKLC